MHHCRPRHLLSHWLSGLLLATAVGWPTALLHGQQNWAQRDKWQRPAEVLDALEVKPDSRVADVGAGEGYFTLHLADRVGPQGKVYAEDILESRLKKIQEAKQHRNLSQIETILGTPSDPRLPADALDAILVVNAYHEMLEYDAMLGGMYRALKPGGRLAVIDAADELGQPRSVYQRRHTLPRQIAREDAERSGFRFLRELPGFSEPGGGRKYYFLLFEKTKADSAPGQSRLLQDQDHRRPAAYPSRGGRHRQDLVRYLVHVPAEGSGAMPQVEVIAPRLWIGR